VRVCWKEWADLKIFKLYAWKADYDSSAPQCMLTPGPILQYCDPGSPKCKGGATGSDEELEGRKPGQQFNMVGDLSLARFPFDGRGSCNGKGNDANITAPENASCTPYTCTQERYIDFPYLDPAFPPDQSRVEELKGGTVISIKDIVILIMLIWFMYEFNKLVPNIAKQLASGGTGGGVNLNATASSLGGAMFDYMAKAPASKISEATGLAGTARAIRFGVVGIKEAVQDKMYKNLVKPIEDRVDPLKKAIEKKMENSSAIRALKVGATIVKGILKPHEVAGYMVSKVGENLQHKKEVAKKGVANVANKAKEAILGKAGQAKDAVMRRFGGGDKTPPQDAGAAPRGGVPSAGVPTPGAQGAGAQPNQPAPRATEADGTVAPEGEAANPDSEAALADGHDVQGPNAQTTPRAAEAGVLAGSEGEVANPDSEAAQADGHDVQGPHAQRTPQAAAGEAYNQAHAAHADGDELAAEAPLAQLAPRDEVSGVKAGLSDEAINPALAEAQADQPAEGAQADGQASAEAKDAAEDLAAGTDGTEKAANSPDEAAGSATDGQAPAEVKDAAEELTARTDIKEEAANTPDGAAGSALDDEAPAPAQPASEVSYDEPAQPTKDSAADPLTDRIKKAIDEKAALDAKSARMAEFEEAADAITEEQPHTPDEGKDKRDGST
jgi:hypothetical protein